MSGGPEIKNLSFEEFRQAWEVSRQLLRQVPASGVRVMAAIQNTIVANAPDCVDREFLVECGMLRKKP